MMTYDLSRFERMPRKNAHTCSRTCSYEQALNLIMKSTGSFTACAINLRTMLMVLD